MLPLLAKEGQWRGVTVERDSQNRRRQASAFPKSTTHESVGEITATFSCEGAGNIGSERRSPLKKRRT